MQCWKQAKICNDKNRGIWNCRYTFDYQWWYGGTIACESCNEEVCDQMINITIILL